MARYITYHPMRKESFMTSARRHGWFPRDNSVLMKEGHVITAEQHGKRVIIRGLTDKDAEKFRSLISSDDPRFQELYEEELGNN